MIDPVTSVKITTSVEHDVPSSGIYDSVSVYHMELSSSAYSLDGKNIMPIQYNPFFASTMLSSNNPIGSYLEDASSFYSSLELNDLVRRVTEKWDGPKPFELFSSMSYLGRSSVLLTEYIVEEYPKTQITIFGFGSVFEQKKLESSKSLDALDSLNQINFIIDSLDLGQNIRLCPFFAKSVYSVMQSFNLSSADSIARFSSALFPLEDTNGWAGYKTFVKDSIDLSCGSISQSKGFVAPCSNLLQTHFDDLKYAEQNLLPFVDRDSLKECRELYISLAEFSVVEE